jgi:hypothetical protein
MRRTPQAVAAALLLQLVVGSATASDQTHEIGVQAYIYAYPMVLMEITRRVHVNVEAPTGVQAPMNRFAHVRAFPDHTLTEVVRPNNDTLYSAVWFDVSQEPLVLSVPDTGGRYYMLPILDMWTEVAATPGSRTTGAEAASFAILGPRWNGALPDGVVPIRSPTNMGWVIGRTQTNGAADYENVHRIQDAYRAVPLSAWGRPETAATKARVDPAWDMKTPPPVQVARMGAEAFFELFARLLKDNPPRAADWNMVAQLKRIGITPGEDFRFSGLPVETRRTLERAVQDAQKLIAGRRQGEPVNGWYMMREFMGNYGTSYLQRAFIAHIGLGANQVEDAVYGLSGVDADGRPYDGSKQYVLHFDKGGLPPVRGFWSLTLYNDRMYLAANDLRRYALGDRDELRLNEDGSLDIYIQHESPGKDRESNWLPAPKGRFDLVLRLYWPRVDVLTGGWNPPAVKPAGPQH